MNVQLPIKDAIGDTGSEKLREPPRPRRISMMRTLLACLATLVVSLSGPSMAQTPTGTIQGAVQDASGALVPDVKIRVININTNEARELRTDSAGRYVQPYLLPGTYSVMAEKTGFQSVRLDSIKLDVGQNRL